MPVPDQGRAWGWVAALRDGTTTPWSHWPTDAGTAPASGRDLPGAQHLELARRINVAGQGHPARAALVERALRASAAGRGVDERELVGAVPTRAWGRPPVDPSALADDDLLAVAASLVADDLVAADPRRHGSTGSSRSRVTGLPGRVHRALLRRLHARRPGLRVVGDPWRAMAAHDVLLQRGRRLDGAHDARGAGVGGSTVVLLGDDLASLLVDTYTARAFGAGVRSWDRWLADLEHGSLPPGVDLAQAARRWTSSPGSRRALVVLDPALAGDALGLPARLHRRLDPARPSADAVDLARRVTVPLAVRVTPEDRRRLLRRVLLPAVVADRAHHPAPPLQVSEVHRSWVVRRAEGVRDDLRVAGYPVLGDLQGLLPGDGSPLGAGDPSDGTGVLPLALRLLLAGPPAGPSAVPRSTAPSAPPDRFEEP